MGHLSHSYKRGAINLDLECGVTPKQLAEEYGVNLEANQNLAARVCFRFCQIRCLCHLSGKWDDHRKDCCRNL